MLAVTYGATAQQLSPKMNKSKELVQEDVDRYFEEFPGVQSMMTNAHSTAKRDGQVLSYFGRPRRMPNAKKIDKLYGKLSHNQLPYEARNILNLAVNHTIQSTAASIVNRAAIRFKEIVSGKIHCSLALQVHDSLIVECNESDANEVARILQEAMETTTQLEGIALQAIPKIGHDLSKV